MHIQINSLVSNFIKLFF